MKINVNNTVEVVLQLINSRWKGIVIELSVLTSNFFLLCLLFFFSYLTAAVTRDLKNYGLYLHSQEDGWWLQRDYPLSVYDIGVMVSRCAPVPRHPSSD